MEAGTRTEDRVEEIGVKVRSSTSPRRVAEEWRLNLHESETIPKSSYITETGMLSILKMGVPSKMFLLSFAATWG
jgi:hypothetical protein